MRIASNTSIVIEQLCEHERSSNITSRLQNGWNDTEKALNIIKSGNQYVLRSVFVKFQSAYELDANLALR